MRLVYLGRSTSTSERRVRPWAPTAVHGLDRLVLHLGVLDLMDGSEAEGRTPWCTAPS
jgi:hypothetical protein